VPSLLFKIFIGEYSGISAGVFGILGSLALAMPPIQTAKLRETLLQLEDIADSLAGDAVRAARRRLTKEARGFLGAEKRWNLIGAGLLVFAFAILCANSVYTAFFTSQPR
jgi:hypothetical protein